MYFLGLITRCKDEFFIKEFCDYYLLQGVDKIFVIDDDSDDKSIYNNIIDNRIEIIYEKDIIRNKYANTLYKQIKSKFKWMIFCDVDEFITTKKNITNTIKDELNTTFNDVDCIKIPWVMMSCNSIEKNPNSILLENIYRWNHNEKHINKKKINKFRCRYNAIEVKCIFKTDKFNALGSDHHPSCNSDKVLIVDSINKEQQQLDPFYNNLREHDIENGILLCYHYRIISKENSINKLKNNIWYIKNGYTIDDLMSSDHPEIIDETLKNKTINNNIKDSAIGKKNIAVIHIGKSGGSYLKTVFPNLMFYHRQTIKIPSNYDYIIIMLRDPLQRFISAYYMIKNLIEYNVSNLSYDDLYNDKKGVYFQLENKIKNKLKYNNPFYEFIDADIFLSYFKCFNNVNDLLEGLSSENSSIKEKAHFICNFEGGHLKLGLSWYVNKELLQYYKNRVFLIKKNEMNLDIQNINAKLKLNTTIYNENKIREGDYNIPNISLLGINNFYNLKKKDYECLEYLNKINLLDDKTLNLYYKSIKQNIKIFLIGFNKCGTRSLHYFFKDNNLKSIHWDNNNLVDVFENNIKNGNKLLENGKTINKKVNSDCNYSEATVFSDITKHIINKDPKDYYKQLDNDYPNSKFILNTRDVDDWVQSRIKHGNGQILKEHMAFFDCDEDQIKIIWKKMYEKHIIDVKNYFKNRSLDLCIFDIENDTIDKIINFLKDDFVLDKKYYKYVN